MATVTDDDIGKAVQTPDGEPIGQIATIEGNTVSVDPDPGAVETVMAVFGLESNPEKALSIDEADVDRVTDDAVHISTDTLREDGGGHGSVIERDEGTGERTTGAPSGVESGSAGERAGRSEESGDERHSTMDDAPPEGDRSVTPKRGENDSE